MVLAETMWKWVCIVLWMNIASSSSTLMQSHTMWGSLNEEYQPSHPSILLQVSSAESLSRCTTLCHSNSRCRIMDYDQNNKQCRLFQGDLITGQIVSSSSSTSRVGAVQLSPGRYLSYNQSCDHCESNRELLCQNQLCQCLPETFWNGSMCRPQFLLGANCSRTEMCRQALNYTCSNQTSQCTNGGTIMVGSSSLSGPLDVFVSPNSTLYVADWSNNRVQIFAPNYTAGVTMTGLTGTPQGLFIDRLSNVYVALGSGGHRVRIQPNGLTIPLSPLPSCNWSNSLSDAYGIAVDYAGNIYVSSATCHYVTQWQINGSSATRLIAQSPQVNGPRHMFFHENTSSLYVANTELHVIIKFQMGSTITSQVVAGTQGILGTASNRLKRPTGVYVSRVDGTIYVADMGNNRIQKFTVGSSSGVTIAGNSNGLSGASLSALNGPYGISFDPNETFFYVAEYYNNRVQRFALP